MDATCRFGSGTRVSRLHLAPYERFGLQPVGYRSPREAHTLEAPRIWTAQQFEALVGSRVDRAAQFANLDSTREDIACLQRTSVNAFIDQLDPIVPRREVLRTRHGQLREDLSMLGYLDWRTAEERGLVFSDFLHSIVFEQTKPRDHPWRRVEACP